jgi:hypothetical protein
LVDPLPHQILEAYARLRRDADLRRHLYENAIHTFDGVTWPDQLQRAYRWLVAGAAEEQPQATAGQWAESAA